MSCATVGAVEPCFIPAPEAGPENAPAFGRGTAHHPQVPGPQRKSPPTLKELREPVNPSKLKVGGARVGSG